jgi:hypothetical protein
LFWFWFVLNKSKKEEKGETLVAAPHFLLMIGISAGVKPPLNRCWMLINEDEVAERGAREEAEE